jgi:hypothetical protein
VVKTLRSPIRKDLPGLLHLMLVLLAFSAFLTDTRFIPGLRNNVGMFELTSGLLIAGSFLFFLRSSIPIRTHPLILLMGFWFAIAMFSLIKLNNGTTYPISVVAVIIVLFQFLFTLTLFNVLMLYRPGLLYLLRYITIAAAIIGLWVLIAQLSNPSDYGEAGPFRGRSHAAIYMMGAFWVVLAFRFWPGVGKWEKLLTYPTLALAAYTIAAALRQSVYTAMIVGLIGFTLSFIVIRGRERFNLTAVMFYLFAIIAALFLFGGQYLASLSLFRRESIGLESRLTAAFATEEDEEFGESFDAGQRQGAFRAFFDNPLLGIGWMGFYRSEYSPTGHELHSSTLRFMAELGIFGIGIYLAFLWIVFSRALKMFWRARGTPYQFSTYILLIAFIAQAVSHYYNRMFTDRPYWVLLVIFLTLEAHLQGELGKTAEPMGQTPFAKDARLRLQPTTTYRS